MANNTTLNAGTGGDVIATDDVAGVKYQRIKLTDGTEDSTTPINVGHGVAANALRVELPTDGTGVIATVGAVTAITNALPAGTNAIGKLSANSGVDIGDIDVTSIVPGVGATNLGKAEDAAHTSGDTGVMAFAVRRDADTSLVSADGDYAPFQVNAAGSLKVAITSGAGSGGTSAADGSTFTRATTSLTPAGAVVETSAPTLTNGQVAGLSQTTAGALRVAVASGGIAGIVNDAALTIGTSEGVPIMGRASAAAPTDVSADNDAVHAWCLRSGAQVVQPSFAGVLQTTGNGVAGTGVPRVTLASDSTGNIATIGTSVTPGNSAAHLGKAEDAAAASGDTGVAMFAVRRDTPSSDVSAAGDYATLQVDSTGQLWVRQNAQASGGCSMYSDIQPATPAKAVLTSAASQLYGIQCFNLLATPVYLKIWDLATGSVTLGTTACTYQYMIPGNTAGAGFTVPIPPGVVFANGIIFATTGAISKTDNTSITASSVIVNAQYK